MKPPLNKAKLAIIVLMRIMGVGGLLAVPAIFLPYSWMNSIHDFMGLGTMPDTAIVSYLARSLSAFYAIVGTITLFVSLDIRRHHSFVRLWAMIVTVMGVVLFGIDMLGCSYCGYSGRLSWCPTIISNHRRQTDESSPLHGTAGRHSVKVHIVECEDVSTSTVGLISA